MCEFTAATSPPTILSRSSRPRFSSLRRDSARLSVPLEQRCQALDKGRGGEGRSPSWNTRRLSRERLREHLEESRLIDELGWVCPAGSFEATVRSARQKLVAACDYAMPRRKRRQAKGSMY